MRLFFILLIGTILFVTLAVAEHKWPGSSDYYVYQGPPAPLSRDGRVVDTPEVAHAKAVHLATHAEVAAQVAHDPHAVWEEVYDNGDNTYEEHPYAPKETKVYKGPPAPLGHDGRVIDTPEVAEAKAAHLAAHAQAAAKASLDYDYHGTHNDVWDGQSSQHVYVDSHKPIGVSYVHHAPQGYKGPPAPLAPDGRVIDTPEVAHAKEAHLRAHAYAAALAAHQEHQLYYQKY